MMAPVPPLPPLDSVSSEDGDTPRTGDSAESQSFRCAICLVQSPTPPRLQASVVPKPLLSSKLSYLRAPYALAWCVVQAVDGLHGAVSLETALDRMTDCSHRQPPFCASDLAFRRSGSVRSCVL